MVSGFAKEPRDPLDGRSHPRARWGRLVWSTDLDLSTPSLGSMAKYTATEKKALVAGLADVEERNRVWERLHATVESLGGRGLIDIARPTSTYGSVVLSCPLHLTAAGLREARKLLKTPG